MMKNILKWIVTVLFVLGLAAVPFLGGWYCGERRAYLRSDHKTDTLYIPREIVVEKPVEIVKWRTAVRTDTVRLSSVDTLTVRDSILVEVPIEQRVFADTNYTAWVSGFRPALDSIRITAPTMVIKETVRKPAPRFGFGLAAGPSVLYNGGFHAGVGVTAGLTYRF